MARPSVSADACETAGLLARLGGSVFVPLHITDNWVRFPSHSESWTQALKLFLRYYGFEHPGAPPLYKEEAVHAVENCEDILNTEEGSDRVWKEFERLCLQKCNGTNADRNPLNSKWPYCDAVTFCKTLAAPDDQNIYSFCLSKIKSDNVRVAHNALRKIRGIGPKVASLFLRDIALTNSITDTGLRDRGLLQPIDVWLGRTAQLLIGRKLTKDDAAQQLVRLADEAKVSALCLNAGSWYFGSQVARTEQNFRTALKDPRSFKSAIERHRNAAEGRRRQLLDEAGLLDSRPREGAGHAGRPAGMTGQRAADEKSDYDRFTWNLEDVVWEKPGQTEEEAIEEAKRRRALKKTSAAGIAPKEKKQLL